MRIAAGLMCGLAAFSRRFIGRRDGVVLAEGPASLATSRRYEFDAESPLHVSLLHGRGRRRTAVGSRQLSGSWTIVVQLMLALAVAFSLPEPVGAQGASAKSALAKEPSCPSLDFEAFISVFSEQPAVQRKFTLFPLKFRDYDDNFDLKTRHFSSFEATPTFDEKFGGTIFANSEQRKSQNLDVKMVNKAKGESREVLLVSANAGVSVHYFFKMRQGCWFLYAIDDTST
jgi:hypothetical protein